MLYYLLLHSHDIIDNRAYALLSMMSWSLCNATMSVSNHSELHSTTPSVECNAFLSHQGEFLQKEGRIPYLLDQTPLSISRRSQIVAAPPDVLNEIVALSNTIAAANSRVAHAHVNKPRARMATSNEYTIGTWTHAVQRSSAFFEARRAIIVWNHWKKTIGSAV